MLQVTQILFRKVQRYFRSQNSIHSIEDLGTCIANPCVLWNGKRPGNHQGALRTEGLWGIPSLAVGVSGIDSSENKPNPSQEYENCFHGTSPFLFPSQLAVHNGYIIYQEPRHGKRREPVSLGLRTVT